MLKLTLKPGEFIDIGNDIKVIFSGGSSNNIHLLVEAPREMNIVRSNAGKGKNTPYYGERKISDEAQHKINRIIMQEKRRQRKEDINEMQEM